MSSATDRVVRLADGVVAADVAGATTARPGKRTAPGHGRSLTVPIVVTVGLVAALTIGGFALRGGTPVESPPPIASATASPSAGASPTLAPRAPTVTPIIAVFSQGAFATNYQVKIANPDVDRLTVKWAGPNCGTWAPQDAQTVASAEATSSMTWQHPHPPCAATTDHSDVTVTVSVAYATGTLVCTYLGSESGTGPACKKP